jgi:hypothetical protein
VNRVDGMQKALKLFSTVVALSVASLAITGCIGTSAGVSHAGEVADFLGLAKWQWFGQAEFDGMSDKVPQPLLYAIPLGGDAWDGNPYALTAHYLYLYKPLNRSDELRTHEALEALKEIQDDVVYRIYTSRGGVSHLESDVTYVNRYFGISPQAWNRYCTAGTPYTGQSYLNAGMYWFREPVLSTRGVNVVDLKESASQLDKVALQSNSSEELVEAEVEDLSNLEGLTREQVSSCSADSSEFWCTEIEDVNYFFGLAGGIRDGDRLEEAMSS